MKIARNLCCNEKHPRNGSVWMRIHWSVGGCGSDMIAKGHSMHPARVPSLSHHLTCFDSRRRRINSRRQRSASHLIMLSFHSRDKRIIIFCCHSTVANRNEVAQSLASPCIADARCWSVCRWFWNSRWHWWRRLGWGRGDFEAFGDE